VRTPRAPAGQIAAEHDTTTGGASVLVAVLAGGRGTRMQGGKAMVQLHGRPLISYPLLAAQEAGLRAAVVAKHDTPLPALDVPVLREPDSPRHPLCGVVTALGEADTVLAVACDMPFLTGPLLAWFAGQDAAAAVARVGGALQPFPALYGRRHLTPLSEAANCGRSLQRTLSSLEPLILEGPALADFGDPRRLLFSVNDREDLDRAARWIEG
jgi:molybdopterin-guanine dinucleotide biosynthesis protein A